eukprot:344517-Chlamydomonas_euryale.AAC.14
MQALHDRQLLEGQGPGAPATEEVPGLDVRVRTAFVDARAVRRLLQCLAPRTRACTTSLTPSVPHAGQADRYRAALYCAPDCTVGLQTRTPPPRRHGRPGPADLNPSQRATLGWVPVRLAAGLRTGKACHCKRRQQIRAQAMLGLKCP